LSFAVPFFGWTHISSTELDGDFCTNFHPYRSRNMGSTGQNMGSTGQNMGSTGQKYRL